MKYLNINLRSMFLGGQKFLGGQSILQRCLFVIAAVAVSGVAHAADIDPAFQQLTNAIDIRIAAAVSALSLIILATLWKADFKGNFAIWGGRFIVFALVVLNIGLWATQV